MLSLLVIILYIFFSLFLSYLSFFPLVSVLFSLSLVSVPFSLFSILVSLFSFQWYLTFPEAERLLFSTLPPEVGAAVRYLVEQLCDGEPTSILPGHIYALAAHLVGTGKVIGAGIGGGTGEGIRAVIGAATGAEKGAESNAAHDHMASAETNRADIDAERNTWKDVDTSKSVGILYPTINASTTSEICNLLLRELVASFRECKLQHFLIPDWNLLQTLSPSASVLAVKRIRQVKINKEWDLG